MKNTIVMCSFKYVVCAIALMGGVSMAATLDPVIDSKATSDSNPYMAFAPITFSVAAHDANVLALPLTYTWLFNDGTNNTTGPSVIHNFNVAGTYIVAVFVSNGTNTVSNLIEVVVADTFSQSLYMTMHTGSVVFGQLGKDKARIDGWVYLPADFNPDGKKVVISIGGVMGKFTLGYTGFGSSFGSTPIGSNGGGLFGTFKLTPGNAYRASRFSCQLTGSMIKDWTDSGMSVNLDTRSQPITFTINLMIDTYVFKQTFTGTMISSAGRKANWR